MAKAAQAAIRNPAQAGREFSAKDVKLATLPPAHRVSLRAPAASVAALSKALGAGASAEAEKLGLERQPHRTLARPGRMAGHRRGREGSAGRLRRRRGAAFGGRHLAPQRRDLGQRPRCGEHGQCRLPAGSVARLPFRSAPARAPSSARSRSCCCAPAKTPSASNAGAPSRTTSSRSSRKPRATRRLRALLSGLARRVASPMLWVDQQGRCEMAESENAQRCEEISRGEVAGARAAASRSRAPTRREEELEEALEDTFPGQRSGFRDLFRPFPAGQEKAEIAAIFQPPGRSRSSPARARPPWRSCAPVRLPPAAASRSAGPASRRRD